MTEQKHDTPGPDQTSLFAGLVMMLFNAGMQHLGKLVNPATNKAESDPEAAAFTIDTLTMLRNKTVGNLTAEESDLLNQMIATLQLNYARTVQNPPASGQNEEGAGTGPSQESAPEQTTPGQTERKEPKFRKVY